MSAFSSRRKCISSSSSGAFVLQHLAQKDNACHGTILVTHLAGARGSEALFTNLQINWPCRCESSSSCFRGKGHSSSAFYSLVSGKRSKCLPHKASPAWPLTKVSRGTVECAPHGLPGSSVHGILQAGILEWVAMPFSRGSSNPGTEPRSPALQADFLPFEPPGKPLECARCFQKASTWRTKFFYRKDLEL